MSGLAKALWLTLPALIALTVLAMWNPRGDFWGQVEPPKAQCEAYDGGRLRTLPKLTSEVYDPAKLDRLVREPQNTVSNLAYVAVGLAVLLTSGQPLGRSFGLACIFLGIGSGLYHASLLIKWRILDILGVYVVLITLVAIGMAVVFKTARSRRNELGLALILWPLACAAGVFRNDVRFLGIKWLDSTYVVVATVAAGALLALAASRVVVYRRHYAWSLAVLFVAAPLAFAGGQGDRFGGFWANPAGLIQGHSVWHVLGAVALLAAYEIFASTGWDRSVLFTSTRTGGAPHDEQHPANI